MNHHDGDATNFRAERDALSAEVEQLKNEVERLKAQLASTEASIRATRSSPADEGGHGCGCGGYG